jgi:very-short-patch-repair endonuclease
MMDGAQLLTWQLQAAGFVGWHPELRFHPTRKWRLDAAHEAMKLAVEVEGGAFVNGRHNRATGFLKDMEKYNELAIAGWRLIRVTPQQVKAGEALQLIERAMAMTFPERT